MGFYAERVLPLLVDRSLDDPKIREERRRLLAGLRGIVLEVGFGTGLNLPWYPPEMTRLMVVEPSAGMSRRARGRAAAAFPVEYVRFDADGHYSLETGSVDAVVTTFTLCTIPEPARAIAEFRRVLKPGGEYRFLEHGASPRPGVLWCQNLLNPVQNLIGGGCNLNRPIDRLVGGGEFAQVRLERDPLPKMPRIIGDLYRGVAVK
jgi:SAM-dependent methyltransferase